MATFKGGLPAWKKAGYPLNTTLALPTFEVPRINAARFKQLVGKACILDIRTPKLYGIGNLKKKFGPNVDTLSMAYRKKYLLKIPMFKLVQQYSRIPKDRKVIVMDYRGKQGPVAARYLLERGFRDVCIINGGISAVPE